MDRWLNTWAAFQSDRAPRTMNGLLQTHRLGIAQVLGMHVLALILAVFVSTPAFAQLGSGRPIRIIVPFAPAGSSDVLARVLQPALQQELKQTVIVENRAGAGTNIGTAEVARSEPDGYTLLLTSSAFLVNPALYKKIPYDPGKDFVPIAALPIAPNIFAIKPDNGSGINSLNDIISRAKANPEALNYASPGNGTTPQLTMELFKLKAGINITNIAYNGGGPATAALLGGTVDVLSTALPGAQEQVRGGTMKGVALTTTQRWPTLPDVPTFVELGLPDITLNTEHFLLAPAGTPPEVVERLTKAVLTVLSQDELKKRVLQVGYDPYVAGPDVVKERIAKGVPFFKDLVTNAKIPQIQ
jgi:tripartite-type tricarboxylate transporter receptor subunit TctC